MSMHSREIDWRLGITLYWTQKNDVTENHGAARRLKFCVAEVTFPN